MNPYGNNARCDFVKIQRPLTTFYCFGVRSIAKIEEHFYYQMLHIAAFKILQLFSPVTGLIHGVTLAERMLEDALL